MQSVINNSCFSCSIIVHTSLLVLFAILLVTLPGRPHAQHFNLPDGYQTETAYEKIERSEKTVLIIKIIPQKGKFSNLSSIILRPVPETLSDPVQWLQRQIRISTPGDQWLKDIFDDPDSPFGGEQLLKARYLLEKSLKEMSKLGEWPLKFCDPISIITNPAGSGHELSCHYSIGPITQYLVLRIQQVNDLWYQTTIRTMNKRRLRHFLAITNSFYIE